MALEIERKFLLKNEDWRLDEQGRPRQGLLFRQGYLSRDPSRVVRLRLEGGQGFITVKGASRNGQDCRNMQCGPGEKAANSEQALVRLEFQYPIPATECQAMLDNLAEQPLIEKTRYFIEFGGLTWEIDEFHGHNAGLVLAEVELSAPDQPFARPAWLGQEVSGDHRYANSNLAAYPFCLWRE